MAMAITTAIIHSRLLLKHQENSANRFNVVALARRSSHHDRSLSSHTIGAKSSSSGIEFKAQRRFQW
jgi:hypothetical protein